MLRLLSGVARTVGVATGRKINVGRGPIPTVVPSPQKICTTVKPQFQSLQPCSNNFVSFAVVNSYSQSENFLQPRIPNLLQPNIRTVTKFSVRKGKRKSVKAALKRFFRLSWGGWIRTRAGRFKHLWKKPENRKYRYRQHVFCNATQCTLLDKMVTSYWKRRRYYVDDPYEPYHSREEFPTTRKKPAPAPPRR